MLRVRVRKKPDRDCLQLWYKCPLTGRQITRSAETNLPREAERRAAEWETELSGRQRVENPSWDVFRIRFTDEYLLPKPQNTRTSYLAALNNWERHVGKVRELELITPSVVSQFAASLGKDVESTTVASNLRHLRAAFRWAESMEMIRRAPRIVMPKTNRRRLARARAITHEEFKLMRATLPQVRPAEEVAAWERVFDLLWLSGLRIGEGLQLSWDEPPIQVDLDCGKFPRLIIFAEGQKSRDDQTSVITPEFAKWLRKTPKDQRYGLVAPDLDDYSRSLASHVFADCGERAGIKTAANKFASAHDIRRAFGQRWAKVVRPLTLQKMMRHKSIQTTLSFYVDMEDEDIGEELWIRKTVPRRVPRSKSVSTDRKNESSKNTEKKASKNIRAKAG